MDIFSNIINPSLKLNKMKNFSKLSTLMLLFLLATGSKAQNFITSGLHFAFSADLFDNSLNNSETGIDYLEMGCYSYRVSISNTKISLLQYNCSSTLSDDVFLQNTPVSNPDVSIVVDRYNSGTDVFAIAVYYEPSGNEYVAEVYQIDGGTLTYLTQYVLENLGSPVTDPLPNDNAIRIDANIQGDFVIVWDNVVTNKIKVLAGNGYGGPTYPGFSSEVDIFGNFVQILPLELPYDDVTAPDIAISMSDNRGVANVFITFLSLSRIELNVTQYDLTDLQYLQTSSTPPTVSTNITAYKDYSGMSLTAGRPRIAAPGQIDNDVNWEDNWMVVLALNYSGHSEIVSYTREGGFDYDNNYTDGSQPELIAAGGGDFLDDVLHQNPAISFGFDNLGEVVAEIVWEGGYSLSYPVGTGLGLSPTVIGVSVDKYGAMETNTCTNTTSLIKIVPNSNMDRSFSPSVAGRLTDGSPNMYVCWWDDQDQDAYYKQFSWCDASFKRPIVQSITTQPKNNFIYPNPTTEGLSIQLNTWRANESGTAEIVDLAGRKIVSLKGARRTIEANIGSKVSSLRPGIYGLRTITSTGKVWSQKLVKQ